MNFTQKKIVIITTILIVIACFFAVYLRLFTGKELWYEMFAAILGVIISAVITMVLLKGQTETDVEREKTAKVFEEKLKIYQEYLHALCDVIKDHSLSDEEKNLLKFQTSYVAMHCNVKYMPAISNAVKELIDHCCPDDVETLERRSKSDSPDPVLDNLFCIVEAFRKDLYGDSFEFDSNHKLDTLNNFSKAYLNAKSKDCKEEQPQQRITVDLNVLSNSLVHSGSEGCSGKNDGETQAAKPQEDMTPLKDMGLWDGAVAKWKKEGWYVEDGSLTDSCDGFYIKNEKGNPGIISAGFYQGHYYIQAQYENDSDFSKPLKWEKGGRRSHGQWWQYLPGSYYNIAQGKFAETFGSDKGLQQYVIDTVEELKGIVDRYHRTATWKKAVGDYEHWDIFIWYWDMLACQLLSFEGERTLYMDINEDGGSGNVLIQFDDRRNDKELLRNVLARMGCQDRQTEANGYVLLEVVKSVEAKTVSERVKYWIEAINRALSSMNVNKK